MRFTNQAIQILIKLGWPMFPCSRSKKPLVKWKTLQDQLPTVEQVRNWDRTFRPPMWGVVTGRLAGIVVADFDGDKGLALMRKWGIKPQVKTGSGGGHLYLRHPGWRVPTLNAKTSKRSWPWPGLDIRGDGGFAVLLGHNSNGPYVQLRELVPDDWDALPEEVRTFLHSHVATEVEPPLQPSLTNRSQRDVPCDGSRVASDRLVRDALDMSSNGRNDAGFWLACQLRDNGYCKGDATSALLKYQSRVGCINAKGQRECYTVREAMASLCAAYSRAAREPWLERHPRNGRGSV